MGTARNMVWKSWKPNEPSGEKRSLESSRMAKLKKAGKHVEKARKLVEPRPYKLGEASELIKKTHHTKFNETVELAINLGVDPKHSDQVVRGTVVLPHGSARACVSCSRQRRKGSRSAGCWRGFRRAMTWFRKSWKADRLRRSDRHAGHDEVRR